MKLALVLSFLLSGLASAASINCINEATFETFSQSSEDKDVTLKFEASGHSIAVEYDSNYQSHPLHFRVARTGDTSAVAFNTEKNGFFELTFPQGKSERIDCSYSEESPK